MASLDLITHSSVIIHARPDAIWPHILEPNDWKQGAKPEYESGPVDAVGEVRVARGEHEGQAFELIIETVALNPMQRKVIKIRTGADALPGFASWLLIELDGSTMVTYDVYSEIASDAISDEQREALQVEYEKANQMRFDAELRGLKSLVEAA